SSPSARKTSIMDLSVQKIFGMVRKLWLGSIRPVALIKDRFFPPWMIHRLKRPANGFTVGNRPIVAGDPTMFATDLFTSEFVPAARRSSHLMIVLHGKGDSLRPFREFHRELRLSKLNLLLLNAPRKYLSGYSWYGDPPFQKFAVP